MASQAHGAPIPSNNVPSHHERNLDRPPHQYHTRSSEQDTEEHPLPLLRAEQEKSRRNKRRRRLPRPHPRRRNIGRLPRQDQPPFNPGIHGILPLQRQLHGPPPRDHGQEQDSCQLSRRLTTRHPLLQFPRTHGHQAQM